MINQTLRVSPTICNSMCDSNSVLHFFRASSRMRQLARMGCLDYPDKLKQRI